MTTADRRTGLVIEAHLAVPITSQLCLVDDNLLRLSCLMILCGLPMLKDVVAASAAIEQRNYSGSYLYTKCTLILNCLIFHIIRIFDYSTFSLYSPAVMMSPVKSLIPSMGTGMALM